MREESREELQRLLAGNLPGRQAQWLMAPEHRSSRELEALQEANARESAVLLLISFFSSRPSFYLIERQGYDGPHSGQISLPGGKKEEADFDFWHTALRETTEELGIEGEHIMPVGELTKLFIPVSRFWVHPKVGILNNEVQFSPNNREVKRILNPAISDLFDVTKREELLVGTGMQKFRAPAFVMENSLVWGATAMILSEFSELIRSSKLLTEAIK